LKAFEKFLYFLAFFEQYNTVKLKLLFALFYYFVARFFAVALTCTKDKEMR